jgi:hypothetical protein
MTLAYCLFVAGCIPVRMDVGKHLDGSVLDKKTGVPVIGAHVMYRHHSGTAVLTDRNGAFTLERQKLKLWLPLLPIDYFGYYHFPLSVRAERYGPQIYRPTPQRQPQTVRIELSPSR